MTPSQFGASDVWLFPKLVGEDTLAKLEEMMNQAPLSDEEYKGTTYYTEQADRPDVSWVNDTSVSSLVNPYLATLLQHLEQQYGFIGVVNHSAYRFNRYNLDCGYKGHVDRSRNTPNTMKREISVVVGLNGPYTGGELHFPRQQVNVAITPGDIVVFPSSYTHPHLVNPVLSGVRNTLVTWLD